MPRLLAFHFLVEGVLQRRSLVRRLLQLLRGVEPPALREDIASAGSAEGKLLASLDRGALLRATWLTSLWLRPHAGDLVKISSRY